MDAPDIKKTARPRGRFAPSPTGCMHLGNAFAALLAWLAVRRAGGTQILRIEDLDPQRCRPDYAAGILEDLSWLGLDWDEGGLTDGHLQSGRTGLYAAALEELKTAGHAYPCYCTRREQQQAAVYRRNAGPVYSGRCRDLSAAERLSHEAAGRRPTWRLRLPEREYGFDDLVLGPVSLAAADVGGDFALWRSDGVPAYQLAVVVDDALMGVDLVVRGADILDSTPRQLSLFELLARPAPAYAHVPLLIDLSGRKLSKTHRDLELRQLRARGVRPEAVVGYLACKAGLIDSLRPIAAAALVDGFDFKALGSQDLVVEEGVAGLLAGI
ncbi:MAG: Glutamate--tRNA ligase [Deltaproteobacteria bacterium ADurb.Bin510]|nr:MAG: Glutamate--tRNA ligase [Deltaproteobacteria bacterium ADurb.Bin510]